MILLLALLVPSAEPQCPTGRESCEAINLPGPPSQGTAECNTTLWMVRDYCHMNCPMRLVITDPPELRTWMCAMDNVFEPYSPEAHIDIYHPLNNKELDVVAVGDLAEGNSRLGCYTADYAVGNKNFTGKIVLIRRGRCRYTQKASRAHESGAAMMFAIDSWPHYKWRSMVGSSAGIETFPALFSARHEADYILAALDRGVKVKGKFQYQCNDMPAGYLNNPQDYPWDSCPTDMADASTCRGPSAPEPLCEMCTVEMQLPGAEKLCLFGNDLRPRKKETLIHTSWDMPYTAQQDEVVYAAELADRGCSVSDYAGLSGKILLVPETSRCPKSQTVRSAQEAGAKAYVSVLSATGRESKVDAYSHHIRIPVHMLDHRASLLLQAFVSNGGGRHIPGSGHALGTITFTRGEAPPTDPPTPAPMPDIVEDNRTRLDTSSDFEVTAGTAICIVLICIDVLMAAALFWKQRVGAVRLPDEVRVKTFSIPLKVASMGLSLTLLLLIAIVTFSLTRAAGQESTDEAMDNGRTAVGLAYDSSEKNIIELAGTIRNNIIARVIASLRQNVLHMESRLKVVSDMLYGFNGSWAVFKSHYLTLHRMQMLLNGEQDATELLVYTTRGFFMHRDWITDDRPDAARNDGVHGAVAETQEGWRYGVNYQARLPVTRTTEYSYSIPPYEYNASRMVANTIGDPLAVTRSRPAGHNTWMVGKLAFPLKIYWYPMMAAYQPLRTANGDFHGTLEAHMSLSGFMQAAMDPSLLAAGNLQNMTVVVVDTADKAIIGWHNTGTIPYMFTGRVILGAMSNMYGLFYMHTHPTLRVSALSNYLDSVGGWTDHEGEFDQKDHYREVLEHTLMKITVSGGRAADTGVHNWDVEMRDGGCGACVAYDDQLQKEVLVFDGAATLHLYRNMTRRTPIVAQTQVSGPGELWRSSYEAFDDNITYSDGTVCVSKRWYTTATQSDNFCLMRPSFAEETAFTLSMRIRPDVAYTESSPGATTPRLFSDSLVGEANVRLFANGQLYLFVLRYGCRTKAYDGGFPVGVWTTVTAVATGSSCKVYVNGKLHDSSYDARGQFNSRKHVKPSFLGQYFKGRIDSIQVFLKGLDAESVARLHTHDRLVTAVEERRFFAQVKQLNMNDMQREGVGWSVGVIVPRDDIMRVVDANRRFTLADVQTQEDNTNKNLAQKANATIMVIVAIAATSTVVFLVFNNMLTRPFEQTAAIMAQAAVMRLDSVPQGTSLITELGAMNTAIRLMLNNLKLYKSFMPQSVQLDEDISECSCSSAMSELSRSVQSQSQSLSASSKGPRGHMRQMQCALERKRFSFLVISVRQWHAAIASASDHETIDLHADVLDKMLNHFNAHKGVSEVFCGDRFMCSFNGAKPAGQHKTLSCTCALQCSADLRALSLATSASAVSGEGRVGNMGNTAMRRFSFLTPVITWGHALERFCCVHDWSLLVDPVIHSDVNLTFITRLLDAVAFPKLTEKPIRVYNVLGRKDTGGADEWMYELEKAEMNDPMKEWNACASLIIDGDFSDRESMMQTLSRASEVVADHLRGSAKSRSFEPIPLAYH